MSISVYRILTGVSLLVLVQFVMLLTAYALGDIYTPTWIVAMSGVGVAVSATGLWVLRPTVYTAEEVAEMIAANLPTIEDWIPDDESAFEKSMKQARQEERFFAADTADFSHLEYDEDVPF